MNKLRGMRRKVHLILLTIYGDEAYFGDNYGKETGFRTIKYGVIVGL